MSNLALVYTFSHFFRIFPQGLSPSKQRVLAEWEQKRRKDNKKNRTNRCCTLVVARLSSSGAPGSVCDDVPKGRFSSWVFIPLEATKDHFNIQGSSVNGWPVFTRPFFPFCPLCWPPLFPLFLGTFSPLSSPWKVLCSVEQRSQRRA